MCTDGCGSLGHKHLKEPKGIPFYLPKPLLIVAKNFRNIEETKVGLTAGAPIPNGFDDQSKYADLNARTNFNFDDGDGQTSNSGGGTGNTSDSGGSQKNGEASVAAANIFSSNGAPISPRDVPSDGLAPNTFYTYHIVFVPDMTQKYGLRVKGGVGEIRAAMNLVNGWQFTGLGPYYMKDSSTAQNILAGGIATRLGGQAAADVVKSIADLAGGLQSGEGMIDAADARVQSLSQKIEALPAGMQPMPIPNYAEIHVFEPKIGFDGQMEWCEIVNLSFDRTYLGMNSQTATFAPTARAAAAPPAGTGGTSLQSGSASLGAGPRTDPSVARLAVAGVFGIPATSPALVDGSGGGLQSGEAETAGATPTTGALPQIQVNQGVNTRQPKEFNLLKFGDNHPGLFAHKRADRPKVETRIASGLSSVGNALGLPSGAAPPTPISGPAAGLQSGEAALSPEPSPPPTGPVLNQPMLNQPVLNQPVVNPPTQSLPDALPTAPSQPSSAQPIR